MMCNLKGLMEKGHHDVQMDEHGGIMMCKLKEGGWLSEDIMIWKSKGAWKRWYYNVQVERADRKGRAL